ncbi:hypothetical protein Q7C36_002545 [Tachysurus vachellii]|uniref:ATP synthase subunit f, mitochondrial n=1 Tax=Tachysurus vachellii TaxID=175792 RepID=A0AA88NYD1_TACVA|nr:hypothetical protein Q7C36_002545 [Tachysurus vachellii]
MSLEICPFCGKSFKRLKSHLSYCNMSPGSKTSKVTNKSKEIPTTTFKSKMNKESVLKPHTGNDQNITMKTSPGEFPILQTSVQRPAEDMFSSRLQNLSVLPYAPEMETGYGGTFFCSPDSEISSNENVLMKCQTSKLSSQRQGLMTELRLRDVRLNELASWLGAQTPKSPREAVTMFNKGWQWYYRKYIDVQKGGIGGIAMLIGCYCVLSYIWSYPHIKKDRWRKYH